MTDLLPLPEPDVTIYDSPGGYDFAYTEDQMRAYARAHRLAERERLRVMVEAVRDANAAALKEDGIFTLPTAQQEQAWCALLKVIRGTP
jgi:hypothetical protein